MTQHDAAVEKQREFLEAEKRARSIVAIDTRFKDGIWTEQTVDYADGRRVTEFNDRRKKTIVENRYGEDME